MTTLPEIIQVKNQLRAPTSFMSLPLEVRRLIYRRLLDKEIFPLKSTFGDWDLSLQEFFGSGLVNASCQIRREALVVLFDEPFTFRCSRFTKTPSELPLFPLSKLKHAKLECNILNPTNTGRHPLGRSVRNSGAGITSTLRYLIRLEVCLRSLEIHFRLRSSCRLEDAKPFLQPSTKVLFLISKLRIEQRLCLSLDTRNILQLPDETAVLNLWMSSLATEDAWEMAKPSILGSLKSWTWIRRRKPVVEEDLEYPKQ